MIALLLMALVAMEPAGSPAARAPTPAGSEQGLWLGSLRLCRDTVRGAEFGSQFGVGGVLIVLTDSARPRLERETRDNLYHPLSVRLDGKVVMEPVANEPIAGGTVMLSPLARDEAQAILDAATGPC